MTIVLCILNALEILCRVWSPELGDNWMDVWVAQATQRAPAHEGSKRSDDVWDLRSKRVARSPGQV